MPSRRGKVTGLLRCRRHARPAIPANLFAINALAPVKKQAIKKEAEAPFLSHPVNAYSAFRMASTLALASPNSIWVFSLKNSGFWTPA